MVDALRFDDEALGHVEDRESLRPMLAELEPRDRDILLLRFSMG